ncbi:RFC checkpoint protein Rad17 [Rhodotorula kratochvilovae]
MPRASKPPKDAPAPVPLRQFCISSFLPKPAAPAFQASRSAASSRVPTDDDDDAQLSEDEGPDEGEVFKVPSVPKARVGKGRKKPIAVLDLTEDDEDVDAPSSSPPPAPVPKKKVKKEATGDKKGKGKAVVKEEGNEPALEEGAADGMWVERFAPRDRDDLALHARKLSDVESWLLEAFALQGRPKHLAKYRRVLVLSGPSGAGKTAALKVLAREVDAEIVEWREGTNVQLAADEPRDSLVHRFTSFLTRAGMAPALDFGPDPSDPSPASSSSSSSVPPPAPHARRLLLLEDLPNVSHYPTKLALRSALSQYLSSPRVTAPLVVVVSEALARPGDDEGGGAGWMSGNGRRGESVDARSVCGVEVLEHPACREIAFNPIAPTIMRKALLRTLDRLYALPSAPPATTRPTQATLDTLIAHAGGDIRSALMSLQFLATEGEGAGATSIGGGKVAKKGKGRKRRRGESDDEEGVGAGGKVQGKEGVRKLLQFVTARESSLFIFHALGKVLYNKRWGDSPDDDKKDRDRVGIVQEREYNKLPRHLRAEWDRRPSKVDPDVLFAEAPLDADIFLSYLHHNYPPFTNEIDECAGIVDALSAADAVMSAKGEGEEAFRRLPLTSLYGFHLGVRSTLLHLPSPVPRRKQVLRKSELWETLRLARQNDEGVEEVMRREGGEKGVVMREVVPWLGLIRPPDASPFLLDLATFPPLSTAAQPLVTGAALGEKDVSAADEDNGGDEDAPAVDLSEPRRGGGRVLQELGEDEGEGEGEGEGEEVPPEVLREERRRAKGKQELFDPEDDIED